MNKSISKINSILTLEYIQKEQENQYFDRKSAKIEPKNIVKHLTAFANASGGILAIGIEDDGCITGFEKVGIAKLDVFRRIPFEYFKTSLQIKCEEIKITNINSRNDSILIYHIDPSIRRVVRSTSDDVFLRIGDQSKKLTL